MAIKNKAACSCCSNHTPIVHDTQGRKHYNEFVHGSKLAAGAFVAMFIFLSLGTVIFGW